MRSKVKSNLVALMVLISAIATGPILADAGDRVLAYFGGGHQVALKVSAAGRTTAYDLQANQLRLKPVAFTTNATLTVADGNQIRIGSVAGNVTLTIPSAVVAGNGYVLDIQNTGGNLDGTHTVTIATSGGNINGSATTTLATAYGGLRLISDGTNWFKR
jgi:hypothetical protein